jgi:hypothetical protein
MKAHLSKQDQATAQREPETQKTRRTGPRELCRIKVGGISRAQASRRLFDTVAISTATLASECAESQGLVQSDHLS